MLRIQALLLASALCALRSSASDECGRLGEGACKEGSEELGGGLGLLQRQLQQRIAEKGGSSGPPAAKAPTALAALVKPLAWFHVPKCGSSFLSALIRLPGICSGLPEDVVIHNAFFGGDNIQGFFDQYPQEEYCPRGILMRGGHNGMGSRRDYESYWKGHAVTMLRDPQQRLMSAWVDNRHSWPASKTNPPPDNAVDFAKQVSGCMARMLVRPGDSHAVDDVEDNYGSLGPHWGGPCGEGPPPSKEEMEEAKKRLREGFAFIGLMEEWPLSMCLFHATFGGPCHAAEFMNTRVWHLELAAPPKLHNDSLLEGYVDPYDKEIWEEAQKIFWERVRQYDVSLEKCEPCWTQTDISTLRIINANIGK